MGSPLGRPTQQDRETAMGTIADLEAAAIDPITRRDRRLMEQAAGHAQAGGDYPEVPPGVRTFDPRRIRRSRRMKALNSWRLDMLAKHKDLEGQKNDLARKLGKRGAAEAEALRKQRKRFLLVIAALAITFAILLLKMHH